MTKAADDYETIRRRMEELKAERDLALTGSSVPQVEEPKPVESVYGYGGVCFTGIATGGMSTTTISAGQLPPYTPTLKSTAHPGWPYAGTGFEWRKFVRS